MFDNLKYKLVARYLCRVPNRTFNKLLGERNKYLLTNDPIYTGMAVVDSGFKLPSIRGMYDVTLMNGDTLVLSFVPNTCYWFYNDEFVGHDLVIVIDGEYHGNTLYSWKKLLPEY